MNCQDMVFPSWNRRGGCASKKKTRSLRSGADGVVFMVNVDVETLSGTDHPVCAFIRRLRSIFLMAQPPLLSEEGNTLPCNPFTTSCARATLCRRFAAKNATRTKFPLEGMNLSGSLEEKMKRMLFYLVVGIIMFGPAGGNAWAQATAQIAGTVRDQTGAVLPGVEITVTQTDTGATRGAVSNETGSYVLSNLPIGPYRLEAALSGFRTFVQTGIVLQVNGAPVVNPVLQVGQISEQVEVQANASLVETRSTGVGELIDSQRVVELPLNGRQATQLINLAGAAATIPLSNVGQLYSGKNNPDEAPISVAGGGANSALTYVMDGGTHNDPINNLGLPLPFPDALQEFKVETSALPAQYGQHGSGAVNVVTKSGTNDFHGNAFEFVRNGVFNARDFFAPVRDSLKRNQFGGTLGGPIVHNKLFFFGGAQFTIQRSAPVTGTSYIPTPAMLAGDFSKITSPACNNGRLINLRAPFVNNQISRAQLRSEEHTSE